MGKQGEGPLGDHRRRCKENAKNGSSESRMGRGVDLSGSDKEEC
jgi:hypothetical protein